MSEVEFQGRLIYTGFIHDLSKEKNAEAALKKYTHDLEQIVTDRTKNLQHLVSKLEIARDEASSSLEKEKELNQLKTRFVSMASHEFRTPLTSVQLSASLIDRYADIPDSESIHKHIVKIKHSVSQLTGILNDFLSMEKLEEGNTLPQLKEFNIVEFSEELIEEMQVLAKKNQNIIYQHTGIKSIVTLDPVLLKNSVINLVSNAIKYSGEDTLIEFNTECTKNELSITVKDNGIGIPEEEQKYLFEAFFRAHNTGDIPGTGLGLNIVKRYAELMGGEVLCKSGQNLGTSITLRFRQSW